MYLKYLQIRNFRNLKSACFEFGKGTNTIIGENDSGKSNALTAMRILLDSSFYYNTKRLKETDFSFALDNWKGHWIIISAFFDEISQEEQYQEFCAELIPEKENYEFLKSYIRCADNNYGTVTLFIRPCASKRLDLASASHTDQFKTLRSQIKLSDYEFYYTSRSQENFIDDARYISIVGNIDGGEYNDPNDDDSSMLGSKIDITSVWQHISTVFIDALRDVKSELGKPRNPLRRIVDTIESDIAETDINEIMQRISELNTKISEIPQISNIGSKINQKLLETVGTVYAPDINLESQLKENFSFLTRYLTMASSNRNDIELLGLGHLNILYIALKLVEFEFNRSRELLNIMIIEEPEAHIHTHIQRTLFENLQMTNAYTQIIMSTHSTHLSEVSDLERINIMKIKDPNQSVVMRPTNRLDEFGENILKLKKPLSFNKILSRYLDVKRSVLLFSKGVILVEGDGEEILIPVLVKKTLGVSLDEMGVGLINIGSVGFENVACIFDDLRLQRQCAIITDLDAVVPRSEKSKMRAESLGTSRNEKLAKLFKDNPYVKPFYATYTLEYEFASIKENKVCVNRAVNLIYSSDHSIQQHISAIESGTDSASYDTILTIANYIGKGWYATLLANEITHTNRIPEYILDALIHATKEVISTKILWKILSHTIDSHELNCDKEYYKQSLDTTLELNQVQDKISKFCCEFPNTTAATFLGKL